MSDERIWPQAGRERMIVPAPVGRIGTGQEDPEPEMLRRLNPKHVFMMGDNPALPRMPEKPRLLDFFRYRFNDITIRHLLTSAEQALKQGAEEKIVLAVLLHDLSNGCLIRSDHGYWGAQMIAPYVDEEVAWAVKYHQALRYFPDKAVGYEYPESYRAFFGPDYKPPAYLAADAAYAQKHEWYMSARLVTMHDIYFFDDLQVPPPELFEDIIKRQFREPEDGLGFDNSPTAHMWRTMIWPNNFL